jgi:hypothetical protein
MLKGEAVKPHRNGDAAGEWGIVLADEEHGVAANWMKEYWIARLRG